MDVAVMKNKACVYTVIPVMSGLNCALFPVKQTFIFDLSVKSKQILDWIQKGRAIEYMYIIF